jgi:general secretion pathway protein A
MYEAYWKLTARPFEDDLAPGAYYPSEVHQGALLKLRYAIENRRGAALLCGGSGLGKSMLVHALRRQLAQLATPFVHVFFPQMSSRELLSYLGVELGAVDPLAEGLPLDEYVRRIRQQLVQNQSIGRHAVIAVDEAQILTEPGQLETLRLLLNFENGASLLTLLLVGQTTLLPVLDRTPALEERFGIKCLLRPFGPEETAAYVSHRMTAAGAQREIFSGDALTTLHAVSQGIPRRINRIGDLALLIGFAEEQPRISSNQIEAVADELATVAPE